MYISGQSVASADMNKELLDDVSLEETGHSHTICNGMHKLLRVPSHPENGLSAGYEIINAWNRKSRGRKESPMVTVVLGILGTCVIVFFVMSCVALSRSNSSAVADACGQDMWNVMLSSLVIRVVLVFFLFVHCYIIIDI